MKELAKIAVTITQVIKTNLETEPTEVIKLILDALPGLSPEDLTRYLLTLDKEVGTGIKTISEMISDIQQQALAAKAEGSHIKWGSIWQSLAQGIVFVATILKGSLPPKWDAVITTVLLAYQKLKISK